MSLYRAKRLVKKVFFSLCDECFQLRQNETSQKTRLLFGFLLFHFKRPLKFLLLNLMLFSITNRPEENSDKQKTDNKNDKKSNETITTHQYYDSSSILII